MPLPLVVLPKMTPGESFGLLIVMFFNVIFSYSPGTASQFADLIVGQQSEHGSPWHGLSVRVCV